MTTATATKKSFVQTSFEQAFANIPMHVTFDEEWADGDYLNGAVHHMLGLGQVVKSTQHGKNKRRMILIGTRAGTVVIFERYTPDIGQPFVLVTNVPRQLRAFIPSGSLSEEAFRMVIDDIAPCERNIHTRMESVFNADINNIHVS